ncbi:MAG: hypothetical protein JSW71_12295 [Gemmatimonadota bacterium]|nr:MAG: hypothetical protein JSW71_12295 [Gemmatimonadota bacterium]
MRAQALLAVLVLAPLTDAFAQDTAAQRSSFILKGTLVYANDTPVVGALITVYKADRPALTFGTEVGEGGILLNPRGQTDEEGHFEIEVERSFLPESGEIKLTASLYGWQETPITNDKGILVVLVASPGLEVLDLDQLVGSIYLRRSVRIPASQPLYCASY